MKDKFNLYLSETERYLNAKAERKDKLEKELAELMATKTGYKNFMIEKVKLENEIADCDINVRMTNDIRYLIMQSYVEGFTDGRMDTLEKLVLNNESNDSISESSSNVESEEEEWRS